MLVAEALEKNNLDRKVWDLWHTCGLCKQRYHGEVLCALGWACWRTYLWRPEWDRIRGLAMNMLGDGLFKADHHEDALSVYEAQLSMLRRLGGPGSERSILITQGNLATIYRELGLHEKALRLRRDVCFGFLKLNGEDHRDTLIAANNYAMNLLDLRRFKEAKRVLRKVIPVALRVLGAEHNLTLSLREDLCRATLCGDSSANERRDALKMLEDTLGVMRRVLGPQHPTTQRVQQCLCSYREQFWSRVRDR